VTPNLYDDAGLPVSARSLTIDLLSTMPPRHPVPVGALVRAGALFGIGENSMRVNLARLRARGTVESDARGFYRLSRAALAVNREVRAWSTVEDGVMAWDGSWIAVETSRLPRRNARERERAFRLLGMEALTPALRVRPNNLVGGVTDCRERLGALGFAPTATVFRLDELDGETLERACALWDVRRLESDYAETRRRLAASAERLPSLTGDAAMAESFRVGGAAVRLIALDPLLPDAIVDVAARRAMIDEMRAYDRIGRDAWKQWAGESVDLESSPVDRGGFNAAAGARPVSEVA
jgi:phenylacetic acid degradation operon negative regulatory protein